MEFTEELKRRSGQAEQIIRRYLPALDGPEAEIGEAMEYSLFVGGKRLRPVFMMEFYRMFGGTDEMEVCPWMAAMECIHTYSLVHDDLPAMDDDEFRRGSLTTWKKYGEALGVLTGDALLNYAFELGGETCRKAAENAEETARRTNEARTEVNMMHMLKAAEQSARCTRAMAILGRNAGIYGMLGGQVVDVKMEGQTMTEAELDYVHMHKTGALLSAAMTMGAVLGGADTAEEAQIAKMGLLIGRAYQIEDDVLDVTSSTQELGKPVHSDERNRKCTFASLFGVEGALQKAREDTEEALGIFDQAAARHLPDPFLRELIMTLTERTK